MRRVLSKKFFNRPALQVAKELLGKFLIRKVGRKTTAFIITEVEAYDGPRDKASHASRGPTPRNAPMWGKPGHFYVYFTYGMHWMLNVVTGPKGYPAAVLIRAGVKSQESRVRNKTRTLLINGPARLTKYLRIDKEFNGGSASQRTGLWFEDKGIRVKKPQIISGPRVGVGYAGEWAKRPYNFKIFLPQFHRPNRISYTSFARMVPLTKPVSKWLRKKVAAVPAIKPRLD